MLPVALPILVPLAAFLLSAQDVKTLPEQVAPAHTTVLTQRPAVPPDAAIPATKPGDTSTARGATSAAIPQRRIALSPQDLR